jgi:hypothetical protein
LFGSCFADLGKKGVARAEGETFYFCDLQSKILMNVPIAILFGKSDVEGSFFFEFSLFLLSHFCRSSNCARFGNNQIGQDKVVSSKIHPSDCFRVKSERDERFFVFFLL